MIRLYFRIRRLCVPFQLTSRKAVSALSSRADDRTSHPDLVKIFDDTNGQIKLRAKQKYKVLSATNHLCCVKINEL